LLFKNQNTALPDAEAEAFLSKEKGVIVKISGKNAFIKFVVVKKGEMVTYSETPTEMFVICGDSMFNLIAMPGRLSTTPPCIGLISSLTMSKPAHTRSIPAAGAALAVWATSTAGLDASGALEVVGGEHALRRSAIVQTVVRRTRLSPIGLGPSSLHRRCGVSIAAASRLDLDIEIGALALLRRQLARLIQPVETTLEAAGAERQESRQRDGPEHDS